MGFKIPLLFNLSLQFQQDRKQCSTEKPGNSHGISDLRSIREGVGSIHKTGWENRFAGFQQLKAQRGELRMFTCSVRIKPLLIQIDGVEHFLCFCPSGDSRRTATEPPPCRASSEGLQAEQSNTGREQCHQVKRGSR